MSNNKINNVEFTNSEFFGNNANRLGHIQRIEDQHVYDFKILIDHETAEVISYLERADLTAYNEYIQNPKVGKNSGLVWFDQFKVINDRLRS